jgi:light-regulated signal transduction histidine kinase (bacteriophytochrome)
MSEEYQKVIFDPFTREQEATRSQIQGTGLGMAITKSLVDLMGGTIRVESRLGRGSWSCAFRSGRTTRSSGTGTRSGVCSWPTTARISVWRS